MAETWHCCASVLVKPECLLLDAGVWPVLVLKALTSCVHPESPTVCLHGVKVGHVLADQIATEMEQLLAVVPRACQCQC